MILKIHIYFKMNTGGAREPLYWKKPETKNRLFHEMEKPIHLQTFPPQRLIMWRDSWHLMTLQPNRHSLGTITVLLKSTLLPPSYHRCCQVWIKMCFVWPIQHKIHTSTRFCFFYFLLLPTLSFLLSYFALSYLCDINIMFHVKQIYFRIIIAKINSNVILHLYALFISNTFLPSEVDLLF